jgi:hypothetical protein
MRASTLLEPRVRYVERPDPTRVVFDVVSARGGAERRIAVERAEYDVRALPAIGDERRRVIVGRLVRAPAPETREG